MSYDRSVRLRARRLWESGVHTDHVCDRLGVSSSTIRNWRSVDDDWDDDARRLARDGRRYPWLPFAQHRYENGESLYSLADEYGVSKTTLRHLRDRHGWDEEAHEAARTDPELDDGEKRCIDCDEVKPTRAFDRMRERADGSVARHPRCRPCRRDHRDYRAEKAAERIAAWKEEGRLVLSHASTRRATRFRHHLRRARRAVRRVRERERAWNPDRRYVGMDATAARRKVYAALKGGHLEKPAHCERCDDPASGYGLHGHHEDYEYPLRVVWLCVPCHVEEHAGEWGGAQHQTEGA